MKYITFSFLIALMTAFSSCSNDDDFKTITPKSIAFVHEDGSPIAQNECINPTTNYALLIKTNSNGKVFKATKIAYTLNGIPNSMTLSNGVQQLKGIKLIDGYNSAEIAGSDLKAILYFDSHENFELVP